MLIRGDESPLKKEGSYMTRIDIISGFLGAGKTTLIKKLIREAYKGERLVLIENEFGKIGIDGGFLQEAGIQITEMNSGCICCSLVGDFGRALHEVIERYAPDRILIEPSGVGKLSDVARAVQGAADAGAYIGTMTTVVDAGKCKMYMKNFGEFFCDQVEHASSIILSHTDKISEKNLSECVELLRKHNEKAVIVTTSWDSLSGEKLLDAMEQRDTLEAELARLGEDAHHHHHHDDDDECDDPDCDCHEHHHGHHGHHADEVFTSFGVETAHAFSEEELRAALEAFAESDAYGQILRAKGIVACTDGTWIHFDYVPGEPDIRRGPAGVIGRLCVIGSALKKDEISRLFGISVK